jgi:iron complex outermembrane receptor protein
MIKNLHVNLKTGLFVFAMLLYSINAFSQERTITGTVTDAEMGETLIGVNITWASDQSKGTVTDIDGKYQITVPDTLSALSFSYVGYTTQIIPVTSDVIDVQLRAGQELAEVVVVGYATQKAKEVTSAISSVKEEDFNDGNVNDPIQLIQGKVPGLSITKPGGDPNADFNIRLRGLSTFGANTEPLIIIDGVQGASLKSVDPADIASMDVLRDASAAAIYGTRAASGVIIITTKKGELQEGKKASNVEFSTNFTFESVDRKINVLTPDEYKQFPGAVDYGSETDWMDEVTRTGFTQVYNLAVNGATKTSNYRVSFNYRKSDGTVRSTGFEQFNGRVNLTQKALKDMLTFNFNLGATMRDEDWAPMDAMGFIANYNPTAPVYGPGNDTSQAARDFVNKWGGYFQAQAFSFNNPLAALEQNIQEGIKKEIVGSFKADLKPVDWLNISAFYSQSRGNDLKGFYTPKISFYNATNTEKQGVDNGFARKETEDRFHQLFETTAAFDKDFDRLNVKFLAGYSYQDATTDWYKAAGEGFITDGFSYNNLGAAADEIPNNQAADSYKKGTTLIGFFGRLNLNWDDAVFLTANFRRDGSSMFGENNKWANFPGISGGADIVKFVEIPYVNRLKIRAGYGETGNLPKDPYLSKLLYNIDESGNFFYLGEFIQAYKPVRNPNPDLKWEIKKEFDIGLDFMLLNYRLGGSIDYYISTSSDLMLEYTVPAPPYLTDRMWLNVGELESSGLEFALNYKIFKDTRFKWSTDINFTYYLNARLNKITSDIAEGETERYYGELGAPNLTGVKTIKVFEGGLIGEIIAPIYIGIDADSVKQYEGLYGDSIPTAQGSYVVVGNGLPDWQFGWGNTFSYKNFYLNFFIRGTFGHSLVNVNNARYGDPDIINIQSGMGITMDFIHTKGGLQYSDVHVEKADFVKLDNFAFGYNFNFEDNEYISNLTVYLSGQNLFTITNYSGVDPEVRYGDSNDNNNPLAPGIDRQNTYFSTRSFTLGLKVLF